MEPNIWRYLMIFRSLKVLIASVAMLGFVSNLSAGNYDKFGRGLKPMTEEQWTNIEENAPHIIGVRPNKMALERINKQRKKNGLEVFTLKPAALSQEFILEKGIHTLNPLPSAITSADLPISVDNSQLPSFPPIGNQGGLGSCAAWAVGYYQATHEYGLINGLNNKSSNANILSPKWIYNLGNFGSDNGSFLVNNHQICASNGLVLENEFPYDNNYTQWDLVTQNWVDALSRRFQPVMYLTGVNVSPQNLTTIKQTLANGHVLNFATCIDSWQSTVVGSAPSQANPFAGQKATSWQSGCSGTHAMTIVGYDDTVWIDINGNGVVDEGEMGAFKIANQWGTGYGNQGFMWVAYDAFLTTSAVVNGPGPNRIPIAYVSGNALSAQIPISKGYTPQVIAEVSLSQTTRDQISLVPGVGAVGVTTPTTTSVDYLIQNQGGALEFDGTPPAAVQTMVFALDLTDLLPTTSGTAQRYFVKVNDNTAGNPTVLNSYTLIDNVAQKSVSCTQTPLTCDNSTVYGYIDYTFDSTPPPPPPPTLLPMTITTPTANQNVKGSIPVVAVPQNSIPLSKVEFYVDGTLFTTVTAAPYQTTVNTKRWPNASSHTIMVKDYDTNGNSASTSVTVIKKNK